MIKDFVNFTKAIGDINKYDEHLFMDSYHHRLECIMSDIIGLTGSYPSCNMQPIREATFPINPDTTIDDLVRLSDTIKEKFGIDCFQISIDRQECVAHLLFDFIRHSDGVCINLTSTHKKFLCARIIHSLDLKSYKYDEEIVGYILKMLYSEDASFLEDLLSRLSKYDLSESDSNLIKTMTVFVERYSVI